jgi:hypothetical protein
LLAVAFDPRAVTRAHGGQRMFEDVRMIEPAAATPHVETATTIGGVSRNSLPARALD